MIGLLSNNQGLKKPSMPFLKIHKANLFRVALEDICAKGA